MAKLTIAAITWVVFGAIVLALISDLFMVGARRRRVAMLFTSLDAKVSAYTT